MTLREGRLRPTGFCFDNATVDHIVVYTTHSQLLQIFFPDSVIYSGFQE